MNNLDLTHLETLLAAATPGPWEVGDYAKLPNARTPIHAPNKWWDLAEVYTIVDGKLNDQGKANIELITALRNAAPALIARVRELEKEQEWQTIETAPKDGTELLIGWDLPPFFCYAICYWGDDDEKGTRQDWINSETEWASHTKAPTHWKHLPKPPTE